jgi:DNA polymerase-3 subunit alpha
VNWRDDTMSIFAGGLVTLDISDAEHNPTAAADVPFVLRVEAHQLNDERAGELRSALQAHRGTTPVQIVLLGNRETRLECPDFPVRVSGALIGEIKGIGGFTVDAASAS